MVNAWARVVRLAIAVLAAALAGCTAAPSSVGPTGLVCFESRARLLDPGEIIVVDAENDPSLPDFVAAWSYAPSQIQARVGQVIEFANRDSDSQHTAELDSGACGTDYLDYNETDGLVFEVPGTYHFHCLVHGTRMTGTITITRG